MSVKSFFGFGKKAILAENRKTRGIITSVQTGWWLTVNKRPVRMTNADSAHPYIITFRYTVGQKKYSGKAYVGWTEKKPEQNDNVTLYYSGKHPEEYALEL